MMNLTLPIFADADKAREHLESIRWPDGPICPHCGVVDEATLVQGKSHRPGLYQCNACREPFSVTVGTVMESSHIPLNKWVLGFHLMASSKKGVSAHQLHRMLGVTYKSAWFMAHRIREAMAPALDAGPVGGEGMIVEADETEISPSRKSRRRPRNQNKKVISLIERGGRVRSIRIDSTNVETIRPILTANVHKDSRLMTDTAAQYKKRRMGFEQHEMVNHSAGEYVRDDAHVNSAEGFFSVFKRGLVGTYQHMSEQHLHRYLAEFDFRASNRAALGVSDEVRAARAIKGTAGKRLTYRDAAQ